MKAGSRFILVCVLSLILSGLMILGDKSLARAITALLFILFLPGYVLLTAIFPGRRSMGGLERITLSYGLSIVIVSLLGLAVYYLPWGINSYSVLVSVLVFVLLLSAVVYYRWRNLREGGRFGVEWQPGPGGMRISRVLMVILSCVVIGACGGFYSMAVAHKEGENFTEFYILGLGGKAEGYPHELKIGEEGRVILGIVNHEYRQMAYNVKILMDGKLKEQRGPVQLAHGEKWEGEVVFKGQKKQENIKVEFILTRDNEKTPYRSLHLWMDVR